MLYLAAEAEGPPQPGQEAGPSPLSVSSAFVMLLSLSLDRKKKKNNKIGAGKVSQIVSDQQIRVVSSNRGCRGSMSAPAQTSISSPKLTRTLKPKSQANMKGDSSSWHR